MVGGEAFALISAEEGGGGVGASMMPTLTMTYGRFTDDTNVYKSQNIQFISTKKHNYHYRNHPNGPVGTAGVFRGISIIN